MAQCSMSQSKGDSFIFSGDNPRSITSKAAYILENYGTSETIGKLNIISLYKLIIGTMT